MVIVMVMVIMMIMISHRRMSNLLCLKLMASY